MRGRGAFIVIVGPDGTGKTTLARALATATSRPVSYFHFRPRLRRPLAFSPPNLTAPPAEKVPERRRGDAALGWLRLLRTAAHCSLAYLIRVRPAVRGGRLVIGDRWIFGYLTQPEPLRFYGPAWLARTIVRFAVPEPTVTVNLTAPVPVLMARKQELTERQLTRELMATRRLPIRKMLTLSSVQPPDVLAAEVLDHLATGAAPSPSPTTMQGGSSDGNNER